MNNDSPSFQLNRAVIILRYKQPYIDWVKTAGPSPIEISLEDANDDSEAFLVPDYESSVDPIDGTEDAIQWVEKRWRVFFEYVLGSWMLDESEWPKNLTLKMFREWFDVEYKSMVWDMGKEPFVIEEWTDDELDEVDLPDSGSVLH